MEVSKPLILLIFGLLLISFLTALLSQSLKQGSDPNKFEGVIYEQPVKDGRYKSITLNGKRVFLSRYANLNQGDYLALDFLSCKFNEKYNSYDNCKINVDPAKQSHFIKNILRLRETIMSNAKMRLPAPHDVLVLAMTIGYEDDLPESLTEKLRDIGAIHMLVVSGYNVSLVLNSSSVLFMRLPRPLYILSSLFLLLLFILLTGFDAPIVRSVVMGTFIVLSKASSRPTASLYLLILSAIVMASWNIEYLSNISFQLSFAATFGVIISGYIVKSQNNLIADLASSVGASLFVLPILSFYFGTVSFLGVVSSILLGWLVPAITYLGFIIFAFNIQIVNFIFVIVVDLFFKIVDIVSYFSFLNMEYKLVIPQLILYYIFLLMAVVSIYKIKENLSNEVE